ncbi:hypothetical protein [Mesorhizobium huakuii]|uniref:hypothetical protein n=1 Tax=Mesorhizobium huakuii TaxID=28104 RepID=UPI003D7BDEE5
MQDLGQRRGIFGRGLVGDRVGRAQAPYGLFVVAIDIEGGVKLALQVRLSSDGLDGVAALVEQPSDQGHDEQRHAAGDVGVQHQEYMNHR